MGGEATLLAKGIVEKIGLTYGSFTYKPTGKDKVVIEQPIPDHSMGMDLILKALVNPEYGVLKSLLSDCALHFEENTFPRVYG